MVNVNGLLKHKVKIGLLQCGIFLICIFSVQLAGCDFVISAAAYKKIVPYEIAVCFPTML